MPQINHGMRLCTYAHVSAQTFGRYLSVGRKGMAADVVVDCNPRALRFIEVSGKTTGHAKRGHWCVTQSY